MEVVERMIKRHSAKRRWMGPKWKVPEARWIYIGDRFWRILDADDSRLCRYTMGTNDGNSDSDFHTKG